MRASAELPVFHSMLPGSAMVGLSTAMRRRVSAISGARNRLLDMTLETPALGLRPEIHF